MKTFTQYANSLNESISLDKINSRVQTNDHRQFQAEFDLRYKVPSEHVLGYVVFGSSLAPRALLIDKNLRFDQKMGKSQFVARVQNSMTDYNNGYIENATLVKFNLEKGTMWLAEEDNEDGSISWGQGFKFKMLNLNEPVAKEIGWIS
ncbi:MAG: hypothetical protein R3230_01060 [Nitrosopumilaceae archaeon]|nr:hypothetical protein [Nitrosopumilaceae archaeon]